MSEDGDAEELKYSIHYDGDEEASEFYTKDGQASIQYVNGDTYVGQLVDGQKNGKGKYTWKELKASYDGEWIKDARCGHGKFTYSDGSCYEGEWDQNNRSGKGTYIYSNGDSYCGQYVSGQREGYGIFTYKADCSQLIGEWKGDKFVSGKWRYNDNTEYVGTFNHNLPCGKGTFLFPSNNQNNGIYEDGIWKSQNIVFNQA